GARVRRVYSRKKVVAATAGKQSGLHAALLENAGRSRKDTSRSAPAFRRAPCLRARHGGLVSHWFLRGILCGACCWSQKQEWLASLSLCFINHRRKWCREGESNPQGPKPGGF